MAKALIISILCFFSLPYPYLSKDKFFERKGSISGEPINALPQVKLSTKVISKSYCRSTNQTKDMLRMTLALVYTNTSSTEKTILYKYSNTVLKVLISKQLKDARVRNFEYNASQTTVTDGKKLHFDEHLPGKFFAILQPGNSIQTKTEVWIEVARTVTPNDSALLSGDHHLLLQVSTWDEADISPKELQERWREQGTLWSAPLESSPLKFNISQKRFVKASCNP